MLLAVGLAFGSGCKGDDNDDGDLDSDAGDLPAGSTAIVVVLNPVPNVGHSVGLPSITGTTRDGVAIDA